VRVPTFPNPHKSFTMEKNVSIVKVDKRHYRIIARENWGLTKEQMKGKHVHHRIKRSDGGADDPSNLYVCSPSFHRWGWHDGEEWIEWAERGAERAHEQKDEDGKSLTAKRAGSSAHRHRNEEGKSLHALRTAKKVHETKDEFGRSVNGVKAAERINEGKDEKGRSVNAVKGVKKLNEIMHEEKNEEGKSKHAIKMGEAAHGDKNEEGKSKHAVEVAKRLNGEKNEEGKSSNAVKGGRVAASQRWVDPDHLELGEQTAGNLVRMQKRRSLPHGKENRVRVG